MHPAHLGYIPLLIDVDVARVSQDHFAGSNLHETVLNSLSGGMALTNSKASESGLRMKDVNFILRNHLLRCSRNS
jgi:hypothetical protein